MNPRLLCIVAAMCVATACSGSAPSPSTAASTPAPIVTASYTGDLPPLPEVQFASARPAPITRAAYEFAARHREVLEHIPCFCGCERNGHRNNENCFVASREASGRPVWSPYGIGCGICIDVAQHAARMLKAGASLKAIRAEIDQKFGSEYETRTPTPPVLN